MRQDDRPLVFVDGATAGGKHTGIAAVARQSNGRFLGWSSRQLGPMTNNEAEYEALLWGMALAERLGRREIVLVSDSEVVIWQMRGRSRVVSPRLRVLHRRACLAARYFRAVHYRHVLRDQNEVADALATEALRGQTLPLPPAPRALSARFAAFSTALNWRRRHDALRD